MPPNEMIPNEMIPNEILLQIIKYVSPHDLKNWIGVSKNIHDLTVKTDYYIQFSEFMRKYPLKLDNVRYSTGTMLSLYLLRGAYGLNAIEDCIVNGNLEVVKHIVSSIDDITPNLIPIVAQHDKHEILEYFVNLGLNVLDDHLLFLDSCTYGSINVIKYIISIGFDMSCIHEDVLIITLERGRYCIVEHLLNIGAKIPNKVLFEICEHGGILTGAEAFKQMVINKVNDGSLTNADMQECIIISVQLEDVANVEFLVGLWKKMF